MSPEIRAPSSCLADNIKIFKSIERESRRPRTYAQRFEEERLKNCGSKCQRHTHWVDTEHLRRALYPYAVDIAGLADVIEGDPSEGGYGRNATEFIGECLGRIFIDIGRCSGACSSSFHLSDTMHMNLRAIQNWQEPKLDSHIKICMPTYIDTPIYDAVNSSNIAEMWESHLIVETCNCHFFPHCHQ